MNNNIGDFIKELRLRKNLTQKELGNILDIDDKTISKWERGVYLPDITMLSPLSKALDITIDELLECKLHEPSLPDPPNDIIDENTINESKPPKPSKNKLFLKLIILIIIISSFSIFLYLTTIKKYNNNQDQIAQEPSVNVYKITSNDDNLIIEGYIIKDNNDYLAILKSISIKKEIIDKKDFENYKICLSLSFDNDKRFIFKKLDNDNLSDEGNTYDIINVESQKITYNEKLNLNNIKLSILYYNDKDNPIKTIDFNILVSKAL